MNKITITYNFDYENDTVVTYWNDKAGSHMTAKFTAEDPDYGTDELVFNSAPVEQLSVMAEDWLDEITEYLDCTGDGIYRPGEASEELERCYGEYSNSTLYAIEGALRMITDPSFEKDRKIRNYMTIAEAAKMVASELVKDRKKTFIFCESDGLEATENPKYHVDNGGWHGIKRIDGFFDNDPDEFIIVVGYYGGGNFGVGYVDANGMFEDYVTAIRCAVCNATNWDADNIIYIEEDGNV